MSSRVCRCTLVVLLVLAGAGSIVAAEKGEAVIFMGHSFFAPIARALPELTEAAGFDGHQQWIFFAGGAGGSPGRLWDNRRLGPQIRETLQSEEIDLVGMTFYPNELGGQSDVADYGRWIDLTLERSPQASFFIGAPWPQFPLEYSDGEYQALFDTLLAEIHRIIDELRRDYPRTEIFCIPYGQAMIDLREIFQTDGIETVDALVDTPSGIYVDERGHAGRLFTDELGPLVWLSAIYGVSPSLSNQPSRYPGVELPSIVRSVLATDAEYARRLR
jgi:hypothetical protein